MPLRCEVGEGENPRGGAETSERGTSVTYMARHWGSSATNSHRSIGGRSGVEASEQVSSTRESSEEAGVSESERGRRWVYVPVWAAIINCEASRKREALATK